MIAQDDRIAFSLKIVGADTEMKALDQAKAQLQTAIASVQKLDTANKNLFVPVNSLIDAYHVELSKLDGKVRTTITEQDVIDSANKKLRNFFFPNDTSTSVPSLSSSNNVWTKVKPYANGYALGKNYSEAYPSTITSEQDLITSLLSYIASAQSNTDTENTTGQHMDTSAGSCSFPSYTTQSTCVAGGGIWTPGAPTLVTYDAVVTLKTNMVTAVNSLIALLQAEAAAVPADKNNTAINQAAIDNINNTILPALNTWLAYPDFDTGNVAPTKLHSVQLNALQSALQARSTFVTTRLSQLNTILGTVVQDLSTGDLTSSSGLYGKRYGFLALRLNALGGSLVQLTSMQSAASAQDSIKKGTQESTATYQSILPTTLLMAGGNGTNMVNVVDPSFLSPGDIVFVMAEGQQELQRAVKSVQGTLVTLNDVVPAKYTSTSKARLYKDIS
jgi:hypothetical protein